MCNPDNKALVMAMCEDVTRNLVELERDGDLHVDDLIRVQLLISTMQRIMIAVKGV